MKEHSQRLAGNRRSGYAPGRVILLLALCVFFLVLSGGTALAAGSITRVTVRLSGEPPAAGAWVDEIWAEVNDSAHYSVAEAYYTNNVGTWAEIDIPEAVIILEAEDDYRFTTTGRGAVSVSGLNASFVSSKITESGSFYEITVRLPAVGGDSFEPVISEAEQAARDAEARAYADEQAAQGNTSHKVLVYRRLWWNSYEANWAASDGASRYEVQLRLYETPVFSARVKAGKYDMAPHIAQTGYYSFRVRAIFEDGKSGWSDWSDSIWAEYHEQKTFDQAPAHIKTGWHRDDGGWWYASPDGQFPVSTWMMIENCWYFFDEQGYRVTGWVKWKDLWYYMGSSGAMCTNTRTPDGYYVGADGVWIPGA